MNLLKRMWPVIKLETERMLVVTIISIVSLGFLMYWPEFFSGLALAAATPLYVFAAWLKLHD